MGLDRLGLAGVAPVTPQRMERTPPQPHPSMQATEYPPGMSPLMRSPVKTPDRVGKPKPLSDTSFVHTPSATVTSPHGTKYKLPTYDLHTNFHTFTNKELKEAIVAEGLVEKTKGHKGKAGAGPHSGETLR